MKATLEDVQDVKITDIPMKDLRRYKANVKDKLIMLETGGVLIEHMTESSFRQFAVDFYNSEV